MWEFKGKILVDIREFYEDSVGEMKLGKKGKIRIWNLSSLELVVIVYWKIKI